MCQADALLGRLMGSFSDKHRALKLAVLFELLRCAWGLEQAFTWDWLQLCVSDGDPVSPHQSCVINRLQVSRQCLDHALRKLSVAILFCTIDGWAPNASSQEPLYLLFHILLCASHNSCIAQSETHCEHITMVSCVILSLSLSNRVLVLAMTALH